VFVWHFPFSFAYHRKKEKVNYNFMKPQRQVERMNVFWYWLSQVILDKGSLNIKDFSVNHKSYFFGGGAVFVVISEKRTV